MNADSLFAPIPKAALLAAKARLVETEETIGEWAIRHGFAPAVAYKVLAGKRMAIRGESLQIAIALGLRPDPSVVAQQLQPPISNSPAGHTVAGGRPVAPCNRSSKLQLGEPAL